MLMNRVIIVILYGFYLISTVESARKNICNTLEDYQTIEQNPNCWYHRDVGARLGKIIKRYGYPYEKYKITTDDKFVLTLFRVPHNGSDINRRRIPILLQHGLASDGTSWVTMGLNSSVFIFVNNGYDVWISNARGTLYSSKHLKYTINDPQYWNFSFHELAIYDMPAIIEFIASKTGQKGQIIYVGHSMGTTMSYIYASLKPKHASTHLKSIISLAPVAFLDKVPPIIKLAAENRYLIWNFLTSMGLYGIGQNVQSVLDLMHQLCNETPFMILCAEFFRITGSDIGSRENFQPYAIILSSSPSGLSMKTLLHYGQIIQATHRFQFFDYGPRMNMILYNISAPPEYPLSRIKVPVHLFYGTEDNLVAGNDAVDIYDQLETEKTIMPLKYGHLQFLLAEHAVELYQILLGYFSKN